jgi:hypothetical protein
VDDGPPPDALVRDLAVMRRAQRSDERPDFLVELALTMRRVFIAYARHVADFEGGSFWLMPLAVDSDDPADAKLWVFFADDEQVAASGTSHPTHPASLGRVTAAIAPDGITSVTLTRPDGEPISARVENNLWFIATRDAPIGSEVVAR